VDRRRGTLFGVAAYALWGSFPLYFPLLEPAGPLEILACRVVFSLVVVVLLLLARGRLSGASRLGALALRRLAVAAVLIAVNWGVYIWAVNHQHVVEASLGYFINPLVTVGLGVLVLHERLRRGQWVAIGVGLLAVAVGFALVWAALGLLTVDALRHRGAVEQPLPTVPDPVHPLVPAG